MSPVKVRAPTTIQGSRQIGTTVRRAGSAGGLDHSLAAKRIQSGSGTDRTSVNRRRSERRAASTVSISVTHTGIPAARRCSTSCRRFSSRLATTRSGRSAVIAARLGFFVPRTRGTSRPAGWVHQSVAPASRPGTVTARASVKDGTSETMRCGGLVRLRACPRSSCSTGMTPPSVWMSGEVARLAAEVADHRGQHPEPLRREPG